MTMMRCEETARQLPRVRARFFFSSLSIYPLLRVLAFFVLSARLVIVFLSFLFPRSSRKRRVFREKARNAEYASVDRSEENRRSGIARRAMVYTGRDDISRLAGGLEIHSSRSRAFPVVRRYPVQRSLSSSLLASLSSW